MKFVFVCIALLASTVFAEPVLPENRTTTEILTTVTIANESYIVRWYVAMLGNPSEPEIFLNCRSEIRDVLISQVVQLTESAGQIGTLQNSLATPCSRNRIAFEAEPLDIRR